MARKASNAPDAFSKADINDLDEITLNTLQRHSRAVCEAVGIDGKRVIITRYGQPFLALVPPDELAAKAARKRR